MNGLMQTGGGRYLQVAELLKIIICFSALISRGLVSARETPAGPFNRRMKRMNRICVIMFLAVCALWTFGETLSCDQCGRECADICGTRQFRACCFNNMRKRNFDFGLKMWMRPRRYAIHLHPNHLDYDI